ncbi:hypothetical protein EKH55_5748 (plasmid) [Sinorhizobium alkalisoli]|nr:hypothetical protein EKH55_5748 [Sinorhizobium alkalisoli]
MVRAGIFALRHRHNASPKIAPRRTLTLRRIAYVVVALQ